jgi:hypothetical protein
MQAVREIIARAIPLDLRNPNAALRGGVYLLEGPAPMLGDNTKIPKGAPMQLQANNWQGHKNFTDQAGRRW